MKLYRFYDAHYMKNTAVALQVYYVHKETPKGYWYSRFPPETPKAARLENHPRWKPRWVSKDARKRRCYPTREEALESYRARKKKHVMHLEHELKKARARLDRVTDKDDLLDDKQVALCSFVEGELFSV